MRPLVEPPPSLRCMCGGELRLKLIEPADRTLENREKYSSAQIVAGSKHSSPTGTHMGLPLHPIRRTFSAIGPRISMDDRKRVRKTAHKTPRSR